MDDLSHTQKKGKSHSMQLVAEHRERKLREMTMPKESQIAPYSVVRAGQPEAFGRQPHPKFVRRDERQRLVVLLLGNLEQELARWRPGRREIDPRLHRQLYSARCEVRG